MLLMQRHSYNDGQIGNPEILRLRLSTAAAETFYGWLRLMNSTAAYGGGSGNFGGCNCWSRTIHNPAVRIVWRGWLKMFRGHSSRHVMQREWRRMTETPALLISVIFQSCIFQPFTFVHYIPVLHSPAPDISLSVIFLSCIFSAPDRRPMILLRFVLRWKV